jgi:single-strand DNA-binding protein
MSVEINAVVIGGNLTRDVILREIPGGKKVAVFTVASNRTYVINGEKKKETLFIDVDVWGNIGENCHRYLHKGSQVVVVGRLKQEQWTTDSGEKRNRIKLVGMNVQFLGAPKKGEETAFSSAEDMTHGSWEE